MVLGLVAITCVLGSIGWRQTDAGLGGLEILFGTASLFVLAGTSVEHVPVALGVARLLAPLATASATLGLVLATGEVRLHRLAARRLRNHIIVIGPTDRAAIHLAEFSDAMVVQLDQDHHPARPGTIYLQADLHGGEWIEWAGLGRARRVIVCTGSDDRNLAVLGHVRAALTEASDLEMLVEIDDRSLSLLLAIMSCVERWAGNVDVVCRDDLSVQRTVEIVLARVDDAARSSVAIVGDSHVFELLAEHLARALSGHNLLEGGPRPKLAIACRNEAMGRDLARRLEDDDLADTVSITPSVSVADLRSDFIAWQLAIVDCADPSDTMRIALELAVGRPDRSVWVPTEQRELVAPLHPISLVGMVDAGRLVGPFVRAAQLVSARRPTPWTELTGLERSAAVHEVRSLVAVLAEDGWRFEPAQPGQLTGNMLSEALVERLGVASDLHSLPLHLGRVGIRARPPAGALTT